MDSFNTDMAVSLQFGSNITKIKYGSQVLSVRYKEPTLFFLDSLLMDCADKLHLRVLSEFLSHPNRLPVQEVSLSKKRLIMTGVKLLARLVKKEINNVCL